MKRLIGSALAAALLMTNAVPGMAQGRGAAVPMPSRAVLNRALRQVRDPQLADQVRPDGNYDGAECVVLLSLYRPAATRAQRVTIDRARRAWQAQQERELGRTGADQMIGSSVNILIPTPRPLQQAAAAWCTTHIPRR